MNKIQLNPLFGPAGNDEEFSDFGIKKKKTNDDIINYLTSKKLDIYEYQCGRGVRINEQNAIDFGILAKKEQIYLSLHAPYYISLSSVEEDKRLKSCDYILESAKAVDLMGGDRIIVHSGSCSKISREEALSLSCDTIKIALSVLKENNLSHVSICPETMGKINQLGTLDEVIEICLIDESLIPCIDFGHLYARTFGEENGYDSFERNLLKVKNKLGEERYKNFHCHFSQIEYTTPGGEKKHTKFEDRTFGPDFEPFLEYLYKFSLSPRIICESAGSQARDAKTMKDYYFSLI